MLGLFVFLLFCHFIGDYLLYNQQRSEQKRDAEWTIQVEANLRHAAIHAVIVLVLSLPIAYLADFPTYSAAAGGLVFLFHFIIDFSRCVVESRLLMIKINSGRGPMEMLKDYFTGNPMPLSFYVGNRTNWIAGLLDQGLHVGSIYLAALLLQRLH